MERLRQTYGLVWKGCNCMQEIFRWKESEEFSWPRRSLLQLLFQIFAVLGDEFRQADPKYYGQPASSGWINGLD